jgi:hypothetical protein
VKPLPVTSSWVMVTVPAPVFVSLTFCDAVLPKGTSPKERADGLAESAPAEIEAPPSATTPPARQDAPSNTVVIVPPRSHDATRPWRAITAIKTHRDHRAGHFRGPGVLI